MHILHFLSFALVIPGFEMQRHEERGDKRGTSGIGFAPECLVASFVRWVSNCFGGSSISPFEPEGEWPHGCVCA